jgi:hypothetical protein
MPVEVVIVLVYPRKYGAVASRFLHLLKDLQFYASSFSSATTWTVGQDFHILKQKTS